MTEPQESAASPRGREVHRPEQSPRLPSAGFTGCRQSFSTLAAELSATAIDDLNDWV